MMAFQKKSNMETMRKMGCGIAAKMILRVMKDVNPQVWEE